MSPELGIIGYTNIDVNRNPGGETVLPGGAAYFAALAASRIMPNVGLITRIGYDFDATFLRTRVLPEGIYLDNIKPTGRSTQVYNSEDDPTNRDVFFEPGASADLSGEDIPPQWLAGLKMVHVATMKPVQQAEVVAFLRRRAPHIQISMDTDHSLLQQEASRNKIIETLSLVDLMFVNRKEYELLKQAVDRLAHAVVKLDKDGAMYLSRGVPIMQMKTDPATVVDATGAGDILAGTFLAGKQTGLPDAQALRMAIDVASLSVQQTGVAHLFETKTTGQKEEGYAPAAASSSVRRLTAAARTAGK